MGTVHVPTRESVSSHGLGGLSFLMEKEGQHISCREVPIPGISSTWYQVQTILFFFLSFLTFLDFLLPMPWTFSTIFI